MKVLARFIGTAIMWAGIASYSLLGLGTIVWAISYADSEWGIVGGVLGLLFCPVAAVVLPIHCWIHEGTWLPAALFFLGIPLSLGISRIGGAIQALGKSN